MTAALETAVVVSVAASARPAIATHLYIATSFLLDGSDLLAAAHLPVRTWETSGPEVLSSGPLLQIRGSHPANERRSGIVKIAGNETVGDNELLLRDGLPDIASAGA